MTMAGATRVAVRVGGGFRTLTWKTPVGPLNIFRPRA